jgi:hypothetical protein
MTRAIWNENAICDAKSSKLLQRELLRGWQDVRDIGRCSGKFSARWLYGGCDGCDGQV